MLVNLLLKTEDDERVMQMHMPVGWNTAYVSHDWAECLKKAKINREWSLDDVFRLMEAKGYKFSTDVPTVELSY